MVTLSRRVRAFLIGLFSVFLVQAQESAGERPQDVWTGVQRIVAVGGVSGDYKHFEKLLRSARLIDKKGNWSGGKTHLVQTGDVLGRGPDSRKVMELLMKLEEQAGEAGGYVHALIGNHEAMNLYGDLRYVSPDEFKAFRDENSKMVRNRLYQEALAEWRRKESESENPALEDRAGTLAKRRLLAFEKKWNAERPLGYFEYRVAFGPNGRYTNWILGHNALIRINDTLFMHGGISPKYASKSMGEINETIREELKDVEKVLGGLAADREGPLWYRGLARGEETSLQSHVAALLRQHQVKRIVEGHTHMPGTIVPRFDGSVLAIDAELSRGRLGCLLTESGKVYAMHGTRKLEIPTDSGEDLLRYFRRVATLLRPTSRRLQNMIEELEETLVPSQNGD